MNYQITEFHRRSPSRTAGDRITPTRLFGGKPLDSPGRSTSLADAGPTRAEVAGKHGLVEANIDRLASRWHTDADLGREIECVTDMTKSRSAGFLDYQDTPGSFFDLFRTLREDRVISV